MQLFHASDLTALWHLSPTTLAKIYEYEQETGILELPEEL